MGQFAEAILVLIGFVVVVGCCGAAFALGAALICRWLGWAPINTTINLMVDRRSADDGE